MHDWLNNSVTNSPRTSCRIINGVTELTVCLGQNKVTEIMRCLIKGLAVRQGSTVLIAYDEYPGNVFQNMCEWIHVNVAPDGYIIIWGMC